MTIPAIYRYCCTGHMEVVPFLAKSGTSVLQWPLYSLYAPLGFLYSATSDAERGHGIQMAMMDERIVDLSRTARALLAGPPEFLRALVSDESEARRQRRAIIIVALREH